ncbi:MAG: c-type cytochrome [Caldimonas sp.]
MRAPSRPLAAVLWVLTLAAPVASAQAPEPTALRLRSLAATCAQCHGTDGRPPAGSIVPGLAGSPEPALIEQMSAFKTGRRTGTVMPQLARGFSDAQVRQLAAYFAAQTR